MFGQFSQASRERAHSVIMCYLDFSCFLDLLLFSPSFFAEFMHPRYELFQKDPKGSSCDLGGCAQCHSAKQDVSFAAQICGSSHIALFTKASSSLFFASQVSSLPIDLKNSMFFFNNVFFDFFYQ